MSSPSRRLVVVGGGILGTMHALEGVARGYEVDHLERELAPRGASVRNFGLVWVSGRAPGAELALALDARRRWGDLGADVPALGFRAAGSLTVARTKAELAVLEAAAAAPDAELRGLRLVDPEEATARNPALRGEVLGALHCERDAVVEPRLALTALRALLGSSGAYRFHPATDVRELVAHGAISASGRRFEGDLVVCCPGAPTGGVFGEALADAPLRRIRLQMLETAPFLPTVPTALADGDSLRYYPAYAGGPLGDLEPQEPVAAAWRAQLLLVQRLGGSLTIGDTHQDGEPFPFDLDESPSRHLLAVAEAILGAPLPPVARRWAGVYCETTTPGLAYLRTALAPGVVLVTGPGGRGMTLAPSIAAETFA